MEIEQDNQQPPPPLPPQPPQPPPQAAAAAAENKSAAKRKGGKNKDRSKGKNVRRPDQPFRVRKGMLTELLRDKARLNIFNAPVSRDQVDDKTPGRWIDTAVSKSEAIRRIDAAIGARQGIAMWGLRTLRNTLLHFYGGETVRAGAPTHILPPQKKLTSLRSPPGAAIVAVEQKSLKQVFKSFGKKGRQGRKAKPQEGDFYRYLEEEATRLQRAHSELTSVSIANVTSQIDDDVDRFLVHMQSQLERYADKFLNTLCNKLSGQLQGMSHLAE